MNKSSGRLSVAQGGDADEMLARVAHHYYVLNLTQNEIAKRLGITRFKVHRLLAQARERGMVRIEIDVPFTGRLELESDLMQRFDLESAFVCPSDISDDVPLSEIIGQYAASVVAGRIKDGMTIATSWGRTLRSLANALEPGGAQDLSVVSMLGGLATRSSQDKYEAATVLAARLGAECFYLPGPILCDSVAARRAIDSQPAAELVKSRVAHADIALLSTGGKGMSSIRDAEVLSDELYAEVVAAGAIGNFLGRFIDAEGRPIEHEINSLAVGTGPDEIAGVPCRILCAGGSEKTVAIRAILTRKYASVLVTDDQTARALLA